MRSPTDFSRHRRPLCPSVPQPSVPDRPTHHRDPPLDDPRASGISRGFARHPGLQRSRRGCKRGILVRQLFNLYRIRRASWVRVSFTLRHSRTSPDRLKTSPLFLRRCGTLLLPAAIWIVRLSTRYIPN